MITHKPHFQEGGGNSYIAPELEIVTVEVEKGFATSPNPLDYSDEGAAGKDITDYMYDDEF